MMSGWMSRTVVALSVLSVLAGIVGACSDGLAEARRLENAGDWEAALAVYKETLAKDSDDLAALSGAAVALMVLHRFDEALEYQERLVAADPKDAQTRVELGFNYLNHQDRPDDAARVLQEAADLDPTAKHLTFFAQALEQAGQTGEAEQVLRDAIETDAEYTYAYSQLVRLLQSQGRDVEAGALVEQALESGVTIDDQQ